MSQINKVLTSQIALQARESVAMYSWGGIGAASTCTGWESKRADTVYRVVEMEIEFDNGSNAVAVCRNIRQVHGEGAPDEHTSSVVSKFRNGDRAVRINHILDVRQCFPKRISTKRYETAGIQPWRN